MQPTKAKKKKATCFYLPVATKIYRFPFFLNECEQNSTQAVPVPITRKNTDPTQEKSDPITRSHNRIWSYMYSP